MAAAQLSKCSIERMIADANVLCFILFFRMCMASTVCDLNWRRYFRWSLRKWILDGHSSPWVVCLLQCTWPLLADSRDPVRALAVTDLHVRTAHTWQHAEGQYSDPQDVPRWSIVLFYLFYFLLSSMCTSGTGNTVASYGNGDLVQY
jgi:hypothetical protein